MPAMDIENPLRAAAALRRQGHGAEALGLLGEALRRGRLDAEGVHRAGSLIQKELAARDGPSAPLRVLVLGRCTTSWLKDCLAAVAWADRVPVLATEGEYDNVLQALLAGPPAAGRPDVIVLLPWGGTALEGDGDRPAQGRIAEEVAFWRRAWELVAAPWGARLLQVGHDWVGPGAAGGHLAGAEGGDVERIRRLNTALRRALPAGAYFLDLEQVSGERGRAAFYDPRRYYWTKQPFSEEGTRRLAEHLWAGVRALTTGPKKVLVVDLDNTLWGGVVGEVGPLGIALGESPDGEAFRAFQRHLKGLARRGVLLAVASKNNADDAREPFGCNPDMVLRLEDFAALEINWEPKGTTLARLARTLGLGLDSFVFFDDNPAEREQVRQALPEVAVVDVPEEPAEFVRALEAGLWFEAAALTEADRARAERYAVERGRQESQQGFATLDDYLASLGMVGEVRPIDEADLGRVVQLIGKTNQFNLTTRRHGTEAVRQMLACPGTIGWTLRLADHFGDHGLVAVLLAVAEAAPGPGPAPLQIETWLMSCRVIGRTAEEFLFNALLTEARRRGVRRLVGRYIATPKNGLVEDLYDRLGFTRRPGPAGEAVVYELDAAVAAPARTFVRAREPVAP
jgi:FkbH-like protein